MISDKFYFKEVIFNSLKYLIYNFDFYYLQLMIYFYNTKQILFGGFMIKNRAILSSIMLSFIFSCNFVTAKEVNTSVSNLQEKNDDSTKTSFGKVTPIQKFIEGFTIPSIIQKPLTENECFQEGLKNLNEDSECKPQGIMIHSTASPGTMSEEWFKYWNKSEKEVCVHFFVDDKFIYNYLPCNFKSWHCGNIGNRTHISIEMCEPVGILYDEKHNAILEPYNPETQETKHKQDEKDTTKCTHNEYFEKAWKNLVYLCCCLCKTFGISVDKNADKQSSEQKPNEKFNIISHKEGNLSGIASNHGDPDHWWKFFGKNMDNFRNDVKLALSSGWGIKLDNLTMQKDAEKS